MAEYEVFPDPYGDDPPLDIRTVARVLTEAVYNGSLLPRRMDAYATFMRILQEYDAIRTAHIAYLRRELIDYMNRVPRPILMEVPKK